MNDKTALLAAIAAKPDDDAPRLVYADWLDEHDDPERAAFIRLQVRLARTQPLEGPPGKRITPSEFRRIDMKLQEHQLLERNYAQWVKEDLGEWSRILLGRDYHQPGIFDNRPKFDRGFVQHIEVLAHHRDSFIQALEQQNLPPHPQLSLRLVQDFTYVDNTRTHEFTPVNGMDFRRILRSKRIESFWLDNLVSSAESLWLIRDIAELTSKVKYIRAEVDQQSMHDAMQGFLSTLHTRHIGIEDTFNSTLAERIQLHNRYIPDYSKDAGQRLERTTSAPYMNEERYLEELYAHPEKLEELRARIAAPSTQVSEPEVKRGFWSRLFGRGERG